MKTNAVRLLESLSVHYELREYEVDPDDLAAETVAAKIGMPPEQVFKTLLARGDRHGLCFAVVPANTELDLKALAAATATSIHMAGPGKFFLTGSTIHFLDLPMLKDYMQQMVKMSPLQSYSLEVVEESAETRVIGSAVSAEQAAGR